MSTRERNSGKKHMTKRVPLSLGECCKLMVPNSSNLRNQAGSHRRVRRAGQAIINQGHWLPWWAPPAPGRGWRSPRPPQQGPGSSWASPSPRHRSQPAHRSPWVAAKGTEAAVKKQARIPHTHRPTLYTQRSGCRRNILDPVSKPGQAKTHVKSKGLVQIHMYQGGHAKLWREISNQGRSSQGAPREARTLAPFTGKRILSKATWPVLEPVFPLSWLALRRK